MKFIRRFLFSRRTLHDLERMAWQHSISAAYSESVVPELEKLMDAEKERVGKLKEQIAEKEKDPTYNSRQERKALEKEVETAEAQIAEYGKQIAAVRREAQTFRAQCAEKMARRKFFKTVFSKECK